MLLSQVIKMKNINIFLIYLFSTVSCAFLFYLFFDLFIYSFVLFIYLFIYLYVCLFIFLMINKYMKSHEYYQLDKSSVCLFIYFIICLYLEVLRSCSHLKEKFIYAISSIFLHSTPYLSHFL